MQVINEQPTNGIYEKAKKLWGVDWSNVVFTYGDIIYARVDPTPDLMEHEKIHSRQQLRMGKDKWWERFFVDKLFRYNQEVEAYKAQYRWCVSNIPDRNRRARYLHYFAKSLSGSMYGNMCTHGDAMRVIKEG